MSIDTMDELIAALDAAARNNMSKQIVNPIAGEYMSFWRLAGQPPRGVTPPSSPGEVPTKDTLGAIRFDDAPLGEDVYLLKVGGTGTNQFGACCLYDRLVHLSGLSATSTSVQDVNSVAIDRGDLSGADVELYVETYSGWGATARTLTVNYTDPADVARVTTVPMRATPGPEKMFRVPTHDKKWKGFKSVQSVQLDASTGTNGSWGLTFIRRLVEIPLSGMPGGGFDKNTMDIGLLKLDPDACLAWMVMHKGANTGQFMPDIYIGHG